MPPSSSPTLTDGGSLTLGSPMADAPPKLPIYEGEVLAGKYQVVRVIGAGGVGAVVECKHVELGQRVALKFLLPETLNDAECVARFTREARACVRLKGEHVAHVTDIGRLESGAPYMVMEYLRGSDMAAALEEHGPYDVEEAVGYVLQACEGVAEAHAHGIVHRDIKPRNLFMTRRPNGNALIKVLDFGIAKNVAATTADTALTNVTSLIGSPHYVSPEQITGSGSVDTRTDIWSLGVCLYELLSGEVPFDAPTVLLLCSQVIDFPPRPIADFRKGLPEEIVAIIAKCLEKERDARYQDVGALAAALAPFAPPGQRDVAAGIRAILENPPQDEDTGVTKPAESGNHTPARVSVRPLSRPPMSKPPVARLSEPPPRAPELETTVPPAAPPTTPRESAPPKTNAAVVGGAAAVALLALLVIAYVILGRG